LARIDVAALLAEGARRAAEIDALKARIDAALDRFAAAASPEQGLLFAAACAERAAAVLLWKASAEGRRDEAERYADALEQAWTGSPGERRVTAAEVEAMSDLARHAEPVRREPLAKAAGFAESGALAIRAALLLAESGDVTEVRASSAALWKNASLLHERTGTAGLEAEEIERQVADLATILGGGVEDTRAALRDEARRVGQEWLELVVGYVED
jgi:hypothetical protein